VPGLLSERSTVPAVYGLLAALLGAVAMIPSLRAEGWSVTALPRVDANTPMAQVARSVDPGFRLVHPGSYDGQFYWGIALDPIGAGTAHRAFDNTPYRYGHPLLGWLGWLLSAGQGSAAAGALAALGLLSLLAAGAIAAALGIERGGSGAEGLFVALSPGLLYAAAHDLAEPLCAALLLGALYAYVRGRRVALLACLVLLPLSKEPLVLVAAALAAWELLRRRRLVEIAPILATVLPAAGWWLYARLQFGAWFTTGDTALGRPLTGWARALTDAGIHSFSPNPGQNQLGEATIVLLVALLALLALAGLAALRVPGPAALVYLLLAAITACLAPNATTLLRDALRNTSLLVALVPFVIASPPLRPRWLEPPAAGSSRAPARSPR
jgi:hypothetical protein